MENELELITKVQVQANNVDDADLLVVALQNLKECTDIETIYTDGGYGSPEADETLHVEQIQSAIRGRAPSAEKLNLADFEIKQTAPTQVTCPHQQTVVVQPSSQHVTHFDTEVCQTCPFNQKGACHTHPGKRDTRFHLRFSRQQANMSQRRRRSLIHQKEGRNLRAAVEATVREVKHPIPASKLPVRGLFRVTCMVIGSALVSNVRRIQRYLEGKRKLKNKQIYALKGEECSQEQSLVSFFASINAIFCG